MELGANLLLADLVGAAVITGPSCGWPRTTLAGCGRPWWRRKGSTSRPSAF